MCLHTVDEKTKEGKGYGYKAFSKHGDTLTPLRRRSGRGQLSFPEEVWFTDPNTKPIEGQYPAGFHINRFKIHALDWAGDTTRKVYYREVVASGFWWDEPVYIARQIWITKEEI